MKWTGGAQVENVYTSIRPLYFLCNWSGLACYRDNGITGDQRRRYSLTWPAILKCTSVLIVLFSLLFLTLDAVTFDGNVRLPVAVLSYHYFISAVITFFMIIVYLCLSNNIIQIVNGLDSIDNELEYYCIYINHRSTYYKLLMAIGGVLLKLMTSCVIGIMLTIFDGTIDVKSVLNNVANRYIAWLKVALEMNFYFFMEIIRQRFISINTCLDGLHQDVRAAEYLRNSEEIRSVATIKKPAPVVGAFERKHHQRRGGAQSDALSALSAISGSHLKLCDMALLLHRTFAVHLLILISCCFMGSVSTLFLLVVDSYKANVMFTLWTCSNVVELVLIIHVACSTRDQSAVAARILHKIRNDVHDRHLQEMIETYSLQMHHGRLEFNVCGFFPFDYTLLHTIIASITTYLVIIVQLRTSDRIDFDLIGGNLTKSDLLKLSMGRELT